MDFLSKIINKKDKGKYILTLDTGTRVAKALVSYVDFEERTVVNLGVGWAEQETGNVVGGKITDVKKVTETLRRAIVDAEKMAKVSPKEVIMGFSGNIVRVCTDFFDTVRSEPEEKITKTELQEIIKSVHDKSIEEIVQRLTYRERQAGIKLVSTDVVNFSIDGYRVLNPLNFKGSSIRIGVSSSYVLNPDFEVIAGIARDLDLKILKIAYGPYAVIKALGAGDSLNFTAILIDVGGNITDVVLVKNGNIQNVGMFLLGGRLFTRRLTNKLDISEDIAEKLKIKYSLDRFSEKEAKKLEKIFAEDIDLWFSGIQMILEEAGKNSLLPGKILLYGGGSQLPGLANSLYRFDNSDISFIGKVKLGFVRLGNIAGNTDKTQKLDDFQDVTLVGLAHLCFDRADEEDTANKYLAEII
jgi:cell division protein FtsA